METNQWMWTQWGDVWYISAVATVTWETCQVLNGHAELSHHETKSSSQSVHLCELRLYAGNCIWSWISTSMRWKWWWQYWNIKKFAPGGSHECSHRHRNNIICKFVRICWTNLRVKVIVSWITSLLEMRHGATTTSWSQNNHPRTGNMNSPSKKKFRM